MCITYFVMKFCVFVLLVVVIPKRYSALCLDLVCEIYVKKSETVVAVDSDGRPKL